MKKIFMLIFIFMPVLCFGFDISIFPEQPKAGEGFLLSISDKKIADYELIYQGRVYLPYYNETKNNKEIYLPVKINDKGIKEIIVRKPSKFFKDKEKKIKIDIIERKLELVTLSKSSEAMRDKQPMIEEQHNLLLKALKHRSEIRYWQENFIFPLENKDKISAYFADLRKGEKYFYYHKGIDFSSRVGVSVYAINNGVVIFSKENLNVYGNVIIVDHGQGVVSCYFHLDKLFKHEGELVVKNEIIAETGRSGWATGPHLHFGLYLQGEAVDPIWWINFINSI